jgi:hypothetical protein
MCNRMLVSIGSQSILRSLFAALRAHDDIPDRHRVVDDVDLESRLLE